MPCAIHGIQLHKKATGKNHQTDRGVKRENYNVLYPAARILASVHMGIYMPVQCW